MLNFSLTMPTKIYFGNYDLKEILQSEQKLFGKATLIITSGKSIIKNGYVSELINILNNILGKENVLHFGDITHDPDITDIEKAILIGKQNNICSVIGFGGGSAIDAAKAIAIGITSNIPIADYLINNAIPTENTLPIIAIPTTAGTGAELTKGAIISYRQKNIKSGIRSDYIIPKLAIVNPKYTYTMSLKTTLETGFDMLSHAIESYLSVNANLFSDMLSQIAIENASTCLRRLAKNLDDIQARDTMSYSSMIMGFNVKNVGNCLPHRMQYPIGILTDTTHAKGLIALYPTWFEWEFTANSERINNIFNWLKLPKANSKTEAKSIIKTFFDELEITTNLTQLGLKNNQCNTLTQMVTGNLKNDKLADIDNIVTTIYKQSF